MNPGHNAQQLLHRFCQCLQRFQCTVDNQIERKSGRKACELSTCVNPSRQSLWPAHTPLWWVLYLFALRVCGGFLRPKQPVDCEEINTQLQYPTLVSPTHDFNVQEEHDLITPQHWKGINQRNKIVCCLTGFLASNHIVLHLYFFLALVTPDENSHSNASPSVSAVSCWSLPTMIWSHGRVFCPVFIAKHIPRSLGDPKKNVLQSGVTRSGT